MNEEVISAGLTEDSVSSKISLDYTLGVEASIQKCEDIEIPHRYFRNYLTVLPVNVRAIFVYWEVTDSLMKQNGVSFPLILKIYDESGELLRFGVFEDLGSTYANAYWNEKGIFAELGYLNENDEFISLISSNKLGMPSDRLHVSNSETWMSKQENFEEIIKASLERDMPTSSSITKQMQLALYDARLNTLSSFSILR